MTQWFYRLQLDGYSSGDVGYLEVKAIFCITFIKNKNEVNNDFAPE